MRTSEFPGPVESKKPSRSGLTIALDEQDFLPCSFGGRPGLGAHHGLATLNEVIAGGKVSWVLEADVKNFFGSLDHAWLLRFVEMRVGVAALPPATAPAGPYVVQLAALKPQDGARPAWGRLQKAHTALLSERELAIQEIDLGARGIFSLEL